MTIKFRIRACVPHKKNFFRRLGAMFYDILVIYSLWIGITLIAIFLNNGRAISSITAGHLLYSVSLVLIPFFYFALSWRHGGQSIGLKAVGLQVINPTKRVITWRQTLIRFISGGLALICGGLGIFWMLINREGLAWQDQWSKTRVIKIR